MRRFLWMLLFFSVVQHLSAQYKVRFVVKDLTELKRDSIFIAGNFNHWNPAPDNKFKLESDDRNEKSIVLNLPAGYYEYKYHGGGWLRVEQQWNGQDIDNRHLEVTKDTIVNDEIAEWRDLLIRNKRLALSTAKDDTTKIQILIALAEAFGFNAVQTNTDTALYYINGATQLLEEMQSQNKAVRWRNYSSAVVWASGHKSTLLYSLGDYPKALELHFRVLQVALENKDSLSMVWSLISISDDYRTMKDYSHSLDYCRKAQVIHSSIKRNSDPRFASFDIMLLISFARNYNALNMPDSTLYYASRVLQEAKGYDAEADIAGASQLLGENFAARGLSDSAFYYYRLSLLHALNTKMMPSVVLSRKGLSQLFKEKGQMDSALHYARAAILTIQDNRSLIRAWSENPDTYLADVSPMLAELYKLKKQPDSAYKYLQFSVELKDSLFNLDKQRQFQTLTFTESIRKQQEEQKEKETRQRYETRLKIFGLIGGIVALLFFAIILYRNNKQKQASNMVLQEQKKDLENALTELRNTQKQLVQTEKMASLGELTAGIAHEIQNPLNFVNNFSEVNLELIGELVEEVDKGNSDAIKTIVEDIKENETKINYHGKRADAIVKGMLQHSRTSTGVKEPTDVNTLADEYLRLAYHGLRAKDKSFNATMKTEFDPGIGKIKIVPQDIGRVLLNLSNNAFYAVNEKAKSSAEGYLPTVNLSTKKLNDKIEIRVEDNGNGIPQKALDKIFQPFFTTKPTGQGTGLGLSLSYDIIKAHGGEIKVNTKEGEFTEFVIQLPMPA